ncbi:MAG: S8 family serine peptidase [Nitrosopumilaceae archaeon]
MQRRIIVASSISIMFLLASSITIPYTSFADKPENFDGRFIVVLKDDPSIDPQAEAENAKNQGAEIIGVYKHAIKGFVIKIPNEQALEGIKNNPRVAYVEQDQIVQAFAQTMPTGINRMDADLSPTVSGDGIGSVNVDIAIIDTGIDLSHPDLRVWNQVSYVWFTSNGNDDNGHGTHVAGTAAAYDNSAGVVGVAPGARLWAVKTLDSAGSGYLSWIISGIDYVTAHASEIEVANMSLGFQGSTSAGDTAINNSVAAGVTYVVAAGNSAMDASNFWPAKNPNVITVSAIADADGRCGGLGFNTSYGADDTRASFSNYGSTVDIAAPGVQIWSTYLNGGYNTLSGTSMASPHVAGAAALYKSNNPSALPAAVKTALINSGVPQTNSCNTSQNNGYGGFGGDPDSFHEPLVYVGTVTPPTPVHDISVVSVSAPSSATQAQLVSINVLVTNQGNQAETFGVTVRDLTDSFTIGTQSTSLGPGSSTTLVFNWNTASSSLNTHTIEASTGNVAGEIDTADNAKTASVVISAPGQTPTLHIGDITMSGTTSQKGKNKFCTASSSVLVLDGTNQPASGVSVTGQWSGAYSAVLSASTSGNGKATFTSSPIKGCGTFTFTVNNVIKSGFSYVSSSNVETSDSITLS